MKHFASTLPHESIFSNKIPSAKQPYQRVCKILSNSCDSWFEPNSNQFLPNADKDGPILDFAIVEYPKCGATTLMANLVKLALMPITHVCTPVHQTEYFAYMNWSRDLSGED